ncbi:MAG: membrane dipeptidase [bacterium]
MKDWGPNGSHIPFFITLSHHFWNMLAGHAESLPFLFDQKTGKESGFTPAGRQLMKDLLSTSDKNGLPDKKRRVLIDVKHMSPMARKQYYEYLDEVRRTKGINIPVICSHATAGDAPSLDYFINGDNENEDPDNYFTTTSLSLNDEDIREIIDSDGIIGVVLHEGRIANKKAMKESRYGIKDMRKSIRKAHKKIERFQKELKTDVTDRRKERLVEKINERMKQIDEYGTKMREGYTQMILANIYRIVEVYSKYKPQQKEKGWDHIGIGSDFDGMINKMDYLGTANEFPLLEELMIRFLKNPEPLEKFDPLWVPEKLKELQFGKSPEELAAKIMSQNADMFLQKYFNEDYLMSGDEPVSKSGDNLTA